MKIQNSDKKSKGLLGLGLLTAVTASLCCITPVLALIAGTSGMASSFSWMEPFRPYLIGVTILVLGFAWYQQLKPKNDIDCDCETDQKPKFIKSKLFLGLVSVFALMMLAFPYYAEVFYPENKAKVQPQLVTSINNLDLKVKGMTCESCNLHVEHTLAQLPGYLKAKADYKTGSVHVEFDTSKSSEKEVKDAVNSTGYKVVDEISNKTKNKKTSILMNNKSNISFYNVPLVCNAATSIGCGSRSKPVLRDLEKHDEISKAWLNRKGTAIAVVWNPTVKKNQRTRVAINVFTANNINAIEVAGAEYDTDLISFNKPNQWLQGNDVNKLSKEEAGVIASQLIEVYKQKSLLNSFQEKGIKNEIQKVFYNFFLNFKSLDQLADIKVYRQKMIEINKLSEKYISKNNLPAIEDLLSKCTGHSEDCNQGICSHNGVTKTSCSGTSCDVKTL